jgi:flagellar basal body-associated protein FliL
VRGVVRYNGPNGAPAANVKVFLEDAIDHQMYQVQADGLGVFEFPPRIGPSFFGQYDYLVTAKDNKLDIQTANPAKLTVIAVEVVEEKTDNTDTLIWIAIIIIIVVAVVAGTLSYWAFSSKGRMVECGECGTLVPETATECPKCGIEFEVEVAKCSECESWIRADATVCPFCETPFRDREESLEEAPEAAPTPEVEEGVEVVDEIGDEEISEDMQVEIDVEAGEEVSPEAAKAVPEGLKKEVRPVPVVTKKAVKETVPAEDVENGVPNGNEAENGQPRPRVVKKVAAPPPTEEDLHTGGLTPLDQGEEDTEES